MSLLGIDVGTTGSKSVVVNSEGQVLASAYIEYPVLSPNTGWFELDPQRVLSACKKVIAKTADQVKDSDPVSGIGISSQGEAFTAIDIDGNYLCNAMVSFDARSQKQVESFVASFGAERLYNITGHSAHTLFSLFKIEWLKENRPEAFSKICKIMCMGDLLGFELTGSAAISDNLAARTMMFDVSKRKWSQEVLEAVGIKEGALSKVIKADEIIGTVRDSMASGLGIGRGVPVAAGGHDQSCGALGVGAAGELRAAYSIGTVECITPAINKCVLNKNMMHSNLATYPHVESGLDTTVAFCTTGGSGLKWCRENLGK
jgi:xylulokinase